MKVNPNNVEVYTRTGQRYVVTYRGEGCGANAFLRVKDERGVLRTITGRVELDVCAGVRRFVPTPGVNEALFSK